jgi:hypothetical protein
VIAYITRSRSHRDDTGSSTEEYDLDDVDDNNYIVTSQQPYKPTGSVVTASGLASCDVCLNVTRVNVALQYHMDMLLFVSCASIDTLIATSSNCLTCRGAISILLSGFTLRCETVLIVYQRTGEVIFLKLSVQHPVTIELSYLQTNIHTCIYVFRTNVLCIKVY